MCDTYDLEEETCRDIVEYAKRGGKLFITGHLPHPILQELCGVKISGKSEYNYCYLRPANDFGTMFEHFDASSPYPIQAQCYESVITSPDAKALAHIRYPYTKPGDREFAAIHSNPPDIKTDIPAVVYNRFGKGEVIWICAQPFGIGKVRSKHNPEADRGYKRLCQENSTCRRAFL